MQSKEREISLHIKIGNINPQAHSGTAVKLKLTISKAETNSQMNNISNVTGIQNDSLGGCPVLILSCDNSSNAEKLTKTISSIIEGNSVATDETKKAAEEQVIQLTQPFIPIAALNVKSHGNKVIVSRSEPLLPNEMFSQFTDQADASNAKQTLEANILINASFKELIHDITNNPGASEISHIGKGSLVDVKLNFTPEFLPQLSTIVSSGSGGMVPDLSGLVSQFAGLAPNMSLKLEFPTEKEAEQALGAMLGQTSALRKGLEDFGDFDKMITVAFQEFEHVTGPVDLYFFITDLATLHVQLFVPGFFETMLARANSA